MKCKKNVETIFGYLDYIHFISPLGGEPFLNKDLYKILKVLIHYAENGKIGFIRIVTNGTICPDEEVFELLKHRRVYVLISDYSGALNEVQTVQKKKLIKQLEHYQCKYYLAEDFSWINLGTPKESKEVCEEELKERFHQCFERNCVGIYGTKMYHCSRAYALENMQVLMPKKEECIDFSAISSKEELMGRLIEFYSLDYLSACRYCNACKERIKIAPAIQIGES